ncbi:MAG: hypothetical protein IJL55_11310 [Lachnospiraceae bacterium]|nr:hypothetical protein [Lachnospiraceae bacterium]
MMVEDLKNYMLEVDENYYRFWLKGKKAHRNMHPIAKYEIEKGLDIPGVISWLRISRIVFSVDGSVRGIMLSYIDGEHKRRTVTVPMDKEKKLRVVGIGPEVSDFTFRIIKKE